VMLGGGRLVLKKMVWLFEVTALVVGVSLLAVSFRCSSEFYAFTNADSSVDRLIGHGF
jgi:uncharacterized membrane protein